MVRGDYCYDGISWTETGTALQVRDKYNVNGFLHVGVPTEAVWTKHHTACLSTPRSANYGAAQVTCDGQPLPTCPANLVMNTYSETLFWTKLGTL